MAEEGGDPFDLISRGNDLSEAGDAWAASYLYNQASSLLAKLAITTRKDAGGLRKECSTSTSSSAGGDGGLGDFRTRIRKAVDLERIANLYDAESREYYTKSQQELVRALQLEIDTSSGRPSERYATISAEELVRRRRIFELTFGNLNVAEGNKEKVSDAANKSANSGLACPGQDFEATPTDTDAKDAPQSASVDDNKQQDEVPISKIEEKQDDTPGTDQSLDIPAAPVSSHSTIRDDKDGDKEVSDIEARLASFESTIPSALKSDEERVRDLNAGLKGLGYHLPSSPDIKRHLGSHVQKPMTDEEHIRQIVEMARDEARLEGTTVDEDAVEAALGRVAKTNGGATGSDGDDYDALVINDEDDLAAVLQKAHLNVGGDDMNKSSIAEIFADVSKVKQEAGAMDSLSQSGRLLHLIASAQEHLFEASAHLEEEEDDASVGDDSDAYDDDGVLIPGKLQPLMTTGMMQGKASITEAKKCVDTILKTWPKSKE